MFCSNCGKQIESGSAFCSNCGTAQNNSNNINNFNNVSNSNNKNNSNVLETISLVIGGISIVLAIFLNIFIIPLALIGLVLGIVARTKTRCCGGIILNVIGIVMSVVILIIFISLDVESFSKDYSNKNDVSGHYNCINDPYGSNDPSKYTTTLQLNDDYTFLYGPYGNLDNNYAKGTYTYVDENKTNYSGEYKYYMISFDSDKFIVDGVDQTNDFDIDMEFGITTVAGKRQGITYFLGSENMYYCYAE